MQHNHPHSADMNALIELYNAGQFAELENRACLLVNQFPDFGFGWKLLGWALQMQGKNALPAFQKTAELMPNQAEAHYNLGVVLSDVGQLDNAVASYRLAVKIKPDFAEAHNNLGYLLQTLGHPDAALASCNHAIELKPDYAEAHNNLGNALKDLDRLDDAAASYRSAIKLKPDFALAHNNLGHALRVLGNPDAALASYRKAVELNPNNSVAYFNMGSVLLMLGQLDGAVASYRRALEIKPDFAYAHSMMLYSISHSEAVDAQALFAEHCRFGEQFETPLRASWPHHTNSRDPYRTLQLGFVSGDLRNHTMAYFIEPVLAHLSGYPQFSLHAYYNHTIEDAVTLRLRGYFAHWHPVIGLKDEELAEQIRSDGIDILIDLSGHTGNNRLMAFARKPAPVQASWICYPGTTGMDAIDYYLSDNFLLPPYQYDEQFKEKVVRLPANTAFLPNADATPVRNLPALSNGYVTFGSFNRPSKISPSVIALWSRLMRNLPNCRMLLGAMPEKSSHDTLIAWFAQEGIARERLEFHGLSDINHYLDLHHQVDICLDAFPWSGFTTTLHALWMGVPTLTKVGHTVPSRLCAAILNQVGLEMFVAHDATDFVRKGQSWASDIAALSDIRRGLRERFSHSAMGQPALIAAGLERALRIMWLRWCKGLSPVAIDVSSHIETST